MNNKWSSTHSIQPLQSNVGIKACQNNKHNKPQTEKTSKFKTVSYPEKNSSERKCNRGGLHHIGGQPIHKDTSNEELNIWRTFVRARQQLRMMNRRQGSNHEALDIWEMNFLFKKCNLQGNKAFRFQYTQTFSTSPRCRMKEHEEEAPPVCRICSCLAVEYSKELRVQRFQSQWQIQEKPTCRRRTCHPLGKIFASRVNHSGHNTVGQFCRNQAISVRRAERHNKSTGLERHFPPP